MLEAGIFLRCIQCIKTLISAIKNVFGPFFKFFTERGFGGVQKLPNVEKKVKKILQKISKPGGKMEQENGR